MLAEVEKIFNRGATKSSREGIMANARTCIEETFTDVDGGARCSGYRVKEWSFHYSDETIERVAMRYKPGKPVGPKNTKLNGGPL